MVKIFLSVRNRLEITKKCIYALKEHSGIRHQLYVYDNSTDYLLKEHFLYFYELFQKGLISQVTFTSKESTFNAFSKASACNFFGRQHEEDPKKDDYRFLVFLDNDIIVTPNWDVKLAQAWKYVRKKNLDHVHVIGQLPGGIKIIREEHKISDDLIGKVGKFGGSALWSVRPSFFRQIGFLNLSQLVGHNKKHDQMYWKLLDRYNSGKPYIMGLNAKLGIHCGKIAGSVCNKLTRSRGKGDISFKEAEEKIRKMTFQQFFEKIKNDKNLVKDW